MTVLDTHKHENAIFTANYTLCTIKNTFLVNFRLNVWIPMYISTKFKEIKMSTLYVGNSQNFKVS